MITDKNSQGYIIADTMANLKLSGRFDDKTLKDFFDVATANMKYWESLAIRDTYQELIKQHTISK